MSFVFAPPQQAVVPVQDETYSYFPIRRVFGIARNYAEPGAATKDTPFYFMKDCYTVVPVADGECARIPMPPQSQCVEPKPSVYHFLGTGTWRTPCLSKQCSHHSPRYTLQFFRVCRVGERKACFQAQAP